MILESGELVRVCVRVWDYGGKKAYSRAIVLFLIKQYEVDLQSPCTSETYFTLSLFKKKEQREGESMSRKEKDRLKTKKTHTYTTVYIVFVQQLGQRE